MNRGVGHRGLTGIKKLYILPYDHVIRLQLALIAQFDLAGDEAAVGLSSNRDVIDGVRFQPLRPNRALNLPGGDTQRAISRCNDGANRAAGHIDGRWSEASKTPDHHLQQS